MHWIDHNYHKTSKKDRSKDPLDVEENCQSNCDINPDNLVLVKTENEDSFGQSDCSIKQEIIENDDIKQEIIEEAIDPLGQIICSDTYEDLNDDEDYIEEMDISEIKIEERYESIKHAEIIS